MLIVALYIL